MHADAALRKRQCDTTGTHTEFERGTVPGKLRNEVNDGVNNGWRCLLRVPLIKASGYVLTKVILGHHQTHFSHSDRIRTRLFVGMTTMHDRASLFLAPTGAAGCDASRRGPA